MAGKTTFRRSRNRTLVLLSAVIFYVVVAAVSARADGAEGKSKPVAKPEAKADTKAYPKDVVATANIHTVDKSETQNLKKLSAKYGSASALTMKVKKTLTLGVLEVVKKSQGQLWISGGQLRMELDGEEHSLLVMNKNNVFAVTFPAAEFKDAALQIVRIDTKSAKAKGQALASLWSPSGFLKSFKPTGVDVLPTGEKIYFLQPIKDQADFKRAQIRVADGNQIQEFRYWDTQDNETAMEFSDVKFGGKIDPKLFNYTPPANADVMNL